jgi:hypothetical protein
MAFAIPLAMIAASSLRRWRADMAATRDVRGRTGPLRPSMGMSFRPRCQRAGGIPLHLQEWQDRRFVPRGFRDSNTVLVMG